MKDFPSTSKFRKADIHSVLGFLEERLLPEIFFPYSKMTPVS